jgi:SET domain-containing protein
MPYVGKMCTYEQRENKMKNKTGNYLFELIEARTNRKDLYFGAYIDAREQGNLSRFINHSCDFNCRFQLVNLF